MGIARQGKRDLDKLEHRRMAAARLLRKGLRKSEVARRLKVSPMSVSRWAASIKADGRNGLRRAERLGRRSKLKEADLRRIKAWLVRRERAGEAMTLPLISEGIRKNFGVVYHPGHVWRLLRRIGWQAAPPRARRPRV